jgi:hypothetical protein
MTSPQYVRSGEDGICSDLTWAGANDWTLSLGRGTVSYATNYWLVSRFPPGTVLARIVFVFPACRRDLKTARVFSASVTGVCRRCSGVGRGRIGGAGVSRESPEEDGHE